MRVYTRGRLHAKAYIFDYPAGRFERGIAIVGSSNLSLAGLHDNTELNVVVHGNANHEQLRKWFDQLWSESEPFDRALMTELQLSWALNDSITPYELYLKVLCHLTRERIEEPDVPMPAAFPPRRRRIQSARGLAQSKSSRPLGSAPSGRHLCSTAGPGKTAAPSGAASSAPTGLWLYPGLRATKIPLLTELGCGTPQAAGLTAAEIKIVEEGVK